MKELTVKRIKIRNEQIGLLNILLRRGYLIDDGKKTNLLTRALKEAGVNVFGGYGRPAKKVVLALENPLIPQLKKKTLNFSVFDLKEKRNAN